MISLRDTEKIMMMEELLSNRIIHQPDTSHLPHHQLHKSTTDPKWPQPTPPIPEEGKHIQPFIT